MCYSKIQLKLTPHPPDQQNNKSVFIASLQNVFKLNAGGFNSRLVLLWNGHDSESPKYIENDCLGQNMLVVLIADCQLVLLLSGLNRRIKHV